MNTIKTRVKYIVSYFNVVSYSRVRRKSTAREDLLLGISLAIYITIKWLEARDFALHIFATFLAALEYIWKDYYISIILIALLLSSMRRSQSEATNVHSKIGLATNICGRKPEI